MSHHTCHVQIESPCTREWVSSENLRTFPNPADSNDGPSYGFRFASCQRFYELKTSTRWDLITGLAEARPVEMTECGDGDGHKCHLPKLPPSGDRIQSKSGDILPNEIAMITLTTGDKIYAKGNEPKDD